MKPTQAAIKQAGNLPSGYSKIAEVSYQVTMGNWVTVTEMHTQTLGQSDAYFLTDSEGIKEIGRDEYKKRIRASIGE